uniref:Uncharacterized protein n=1 Tax=Gossypium raimondii TaxID=29730 RepID=A0A0D2W5I9_GOSRA|nr:hypothetical protein B456_013G128300 [Gossypium raimondii]
MDAQRRLLINFMAVFEGGAVFLKAVNCEKEYNNKFYVATGSLVGTQHPHIFRTPYVVHTLNFALKNIRAAKNTKKNEVTYDVLCWINNVGDDAIFIRNFIMNHSMRLAIFNFFVYLKLLVVADTQFASIIVMFKIFKLIKQGLQNMTNIYRHEGKKGDERSIFYKVVYDILIDRWTKSSTPLYCMAYSLNPSDWLNEISNRLPPHKYVKILEEKKKCLICIFLLPKNGR